MREISCTECVELCPDVALGIADAQDRATVLAHVERCRSCYSELSTLSDAADSLCVLAPRVQPSHDFTSRVVNEISRSARAEHGRAAPSPRRSLVRPLSVAAAVVLAAVLSVGGWLVAGGASGPSTTVEAAALVGSHNRTLGQVMVVPSAKPWISVAVSLHGAATSIRCEVETSTGAWRTVGTFELYRGGGYWAAPLPAGVTVRAAELLTPGGHVIAGASFQSA